MDSILALIIVFWIVSAFSKALNPKKRAKQAEKNRTAKHTGGRRTNRPPPPRSMRPLPQSSRWPGQTTFMMPPLEPRPTSVGSLGTSSDEGKDICDPTLGHDGRRPAAYAGSLGADSTEGKDTWRSSAGPWPQTGHARGRTGNAVRRTAGKKCQTPPIPAGRGCVCVG